MKPILVAIFAASVFIIPVGNKTAASKHKQPTEQTTVKAANDSDVALPARYEAPPMLHGEMLLHFL